MKQIKIAITGPECSGKSFLSQQLADTFDTRYVPEFAREYLEQLDRSYDNDDLHAIALGQTKLWDNFEGSLLIADTDMFVMCIWFLVKNKFISAELMELLKQQSFDHYFLCKPDIPWEYDELRENPDDRDLLFEMYLSLLNDIGVPFTIIQGDYNQRFKDAKLKVENLLDR